MQTEQFQLHADIEQRHWWFVARRTILRRLVRRIVPPSPEATIIDVGCGTGANIAALAGQYECVGIDTSEEAVRRARERFPGVRFLAGRAPEDLGEWMPRARLLLLMDVLEHVADDFGMLSELLAAAAPGTCFLITVPADPSLWSQHDESFGHLRRYGRRRFERLWADLPVTALLVSYFNSRLLPVIRAVRAWNRWRGKASGQAGTDFWMPPGLANHLLQATLTGEAKVLESVLAGRRREGYRRGASLVAILRRDRGPIRIRCGPDDIDADQRPAMAAPG